MSKLHRERHKHKFPLGSGIQCNRNFGKGKNLIYSFTVVLLHFVQITQFKKCLTCAAALNSAWHSGTINYFYKEENKAISGGIIHMRAVLRSVRQIPFAFWFPVMRYTKYFCI